MIARPILRRLYASSLTNSFEIGKADRLCRHAKGCKNEKFLQPFCLTCTGKSGILKSRQNMDRNEGAILNFKKITAIILAGLMVLSVSACGKKEEPKVEEPKAEEKVPETKENAFYESMQSDFRPIAVMIDNDNQHSRPQLGLESAYLVYEIVVEGSATRFMALFKDASLEKIGPIRSSRHYFLDYALENDAIYVHAGWSNKAASEISFRGVNNINGLTETIFWRDNTYDHTWHNLYTGLNRVSELADKKGYRRTSDVKLLTYEKEDVVPEGESGAELSIPFANFYKVAFKYNPETRLYERYVNGSYHMSQTGNALTAKNIIVYTLTNVPLNDGINASRQDLKDVGSGTGYYLSEGKAVEINWSKADRSAKTVYTTKDGKPLTVNPGNTYIEIAPQYAGYEIK